MLSLNSKLVNFISRELQWCTMIAPSLKVIFCLKEEYYWMIDNVDLLNVIETCEFMFERLTIDVVLHLCLHWFDKSFIKFNTNSSIYRLASIINPLQLFPTLMLQRHIERFACWQIQPLSQMLGQDSITNLTWCTLSGPLFIGMLEKVWKRVSLAKLGKIWLH